MGDKYFGLLVSIYFVGTMVVAGYFYHGPCWYPPDGGQGRSGICSTIMSMAWPISLPINISYRVFSP